MSCEHYFRHEYCASCEHQACPVCGPGYRYGDDGCSHTPPTTGHPMTVPESAAAVFERVVREALAPTYRFCQSKALTAKALGHEDRPWLDVLLNLDAIPAKVAAQLATALAQPDDHRLALLRAVVAYDNANQSDLPLSLLDAIRLEVGGPR